MSFSPLLPKKCDPIFREFTMKNNSKFFGISTIIFRGCASNLWNSTMFTDLLWLHFYSWLLNCKFQVLGKYVWSRRVQFVALWKPWQHISELVQKIKTKIQTLKIYHQLDGTYIYIQEWLWQKHYFKTAKSLGDLIRSLNGSQLAKMKK